MSSIAIDDAVITLKEGDVPVSLRKIAPPVRTLYLQGNLDTVLSERLVAVVGTRKPTVEALERTDLAVLWLAMHGFGVVSGLAMGIDQRAHWAAVQCGTPTIAVIATGHKDTYPRGTEDLRRAILDGGGAIVSEYPPAETLRPYYLIQRDRIQAALSRAVFVMQGEEKSGTRHTVEFARKYNRLLACFTQNGCTVDPLSKQLHRAGVPIFDLTCDATKLESYIDP